MSRLPTPGADADAWGTILNDYLIQGHTAAGLNKTPYGTTLPASPVDGQEAILVDSLTNPSYQWRFRYNAGSSSAYKWEFIGGAPWSATVAASETTGSGIPADLTTVGPSLALPRAGDYIFTFGAEVSNSAAGNATKIAVTLSGAAYADAQMVNDTAGAAYLRRISRTARANGLLAATAKLQYSVTAATGTFVNRDLQVLPVRVA